MPFAPDPDFVDRPEILAWVRDKCAGPGARAALVGRRNRVCRRRHRLCKYTLTDRSKSQLAIEYAYRMHDRSPELWVFWVHASNAARFEQSFCDIADRVKINAYLACGEREARAVEAALHQ